MKISEKFISHLSGMILISAYMSVWSNFNLWHNPQWITSPIQSSLLHSLFMWSTVTLLAFSLHNLYRQLSWVLSILNLTWLILMLIFWLLLIVIQLFAISFLCGVMSKSSCMQFSFKFFLPIFLSWFYNSYFLICHCHCCCD